MELAAVESAGTDFPPEFAGEAPRRSKRRQTSHLKLVPEPRELRESLRARIAQVAAALDKSRPQTKDEMEQLARRMLSELGHPEGYVGWTMVVLASEFWKDHVAHVPPSRRLFLLPHCLKHAEGCPADYDEFGLDCKKCGACSIADYRSIAEELGYKVLVAEGSPIVLKIIVSGHVDAICGVACLNVLEKAIDKILLAGIPCMAVPLLSSDCRNTSVDQEWVTEMITLVATQPAQATQTYVHLMRAATKLFEPDELERVAPRSRGKKRLADCNGDGTAALDPIAATEAIAYDFLARGGKHSRPFITLAVYDALTGGKGSGAEGAAHIASWSDSVRRAAMSIETFHKASLVHDDIEDDDQFRYGAETIHRKFGIPTAINVGDYLIGLGYRLVSRESKTLGSDTVADILDSLADCHLKLSEGQGAELLWRDARDKRLTPLDALKIYALKTSPAFEAAFYTGARLAAAVSPKRERGIDVDSQISGDSLQSASLASASGWTVEKYVEPIKQFARNLGVAFQILNDLGDWQGDQHNKLSAGLDTLGGRPTLLLALALEALSAAKQEELLSLVTNEQGSTETRLGRVRQLYNEAGVFDKAHKLVDKHQQRAEEIADKLEPEELRRLFYYLIDTVLERPAETPAAVVPLEIQPGMTDFQLTTR